MMILDNIAIPLELEPEIGFPFGLREALEYYPHYLRCMFHAEKKAQPPAIYLMAIISELRKAKAKLPDGSLGDSTRWSAAIFKEFGGKFIWNWFETNHGAWEVLTKRGEGCVLISRP